MLQLPMHIMKQSGTTKQVMVETKNGDSYDGILEAIDSFMNVKLTTVVITSEGGEKFSKCPECFIRGNNIKSIQFDQ
mgnify:CR=1 FL=1